MLLIISQVYETREFEQLLKFLSLFDRSCTKIGMIVVLYSFPIRTSNKCAFVYSYKLLNIYFVKSRLIARSLWEQDIEFGC